MKTRSSSKALTSSQSAIPPALSSSKESQIIPKLKKLKRIVPKHVQRREHPDTDRLSSQGENETSIISLYNIGDTLVQFSKKASPFVDVGVKSDKDKIIKDAFFSIEYNQLMRKPDPKAKLSNHFSINRPNAVHEADLMFLPNDRGYKYLLVVIDIASRYVEARPLQSKTSEGVYHGLKSIYDDKVCPLELPFRMKTDGGSEFQGQFTSYLARNKVIHTTQAKSFHLPFVERINATIAKKLFSVQSYNEIATNTTDKRWVDLLYSVIYDYNRDTHSTIRKKPFLAIHLEKVDQPDNDFDVELTKKSHAIGTKVRRLLNNDEYLDLATRTIRVEKRRATDPLWSLDVYEVSDVFKEPHNLTMHKIKDSKGNIFPHGFTYWRLQPVS